MNKLEYCINDKFNKVIEKNKMLSNEIFGETTLQFSPEYENYLGLYMKEFEYKDYINDNHFSNLKLPINVKRKIVFAWLHFRLNTLLIELNRRISKNNEGYYCADESRELLSIIDDINDLIEVKINVNEEYISTIKKINFLKQTGGSTIPKNIEKFNIKKYEPIFEYQNDSIASEDTIKTIEDISLSSNNYTTFTIDEKIRYLNESLEFLLKKKNGKFEEIDKNLFFGLISNENCIEYRKMTHIFRHLTKENVETRKRIPTYDKEFLVDFGETIINRILKCKEYEK
jgi:hypothetical protein